MSFTEEQRKQLNADLATDAVRQRSQAGRNFSYVEGWWVKDELNRILGAGEWGYDAHATLEFCVETDDAGKGKRWHATYTAKCTLTPRGGMPITDYGAGHGVDRDHGLALESALKEAVTDAMKRAAVALGRRLGLALYDKEQRYVSNEPPPPEGIGAEMLGNLVKTINEAKDAKSWEAARAAANDMRQHMTDDEAEKVTAAFARRKAALQGAAKTA